MNQELEFLIKEVINQYDNDNELLFMDAIKLREPEHRNLYELTRKLIPLCNLRRIHDCALVYRAKSITTDLYSVVLWHTAWTHQNRTGEKIGVAVELHADGSWYFASSQRASDQFLSSTILPGPYTLDEIRVMGAMFFSTL